MACGGDDAAGGGDRADAGGGGLAGGETDSGGGGAAGGGALTIAFDPMYSAYDGVHDFKVPVKVTGAKGRLTVTTSPDGFVDSDPSTDGVTLTTRKAGKTTVTISDAEGNKGTAELTVTENDPRDVEVGAERYDNGIDAFTLPEGGIAALLPEGGFPEGGFNFEAGLPEGGFGRRDSGIARNAMAACTFCHIPEGAAGTGTTDTMRIDVEHTPQQTAGYSDEQIIKIFAEGIKPEGSNWRVIPAAFGPRIYPTFHKWDVPDVTKKGIVAYLRSLTPKAQGAIDFGGLLMGGGLGGPRPAAAMDAGTPAP